MSRIGWERVEDQADYRDDPALRGRINFFRIVIVVVLGLLLFRVFSLQSSRGSEFQALSDDNQFARLRPDPPRGVIFDRHGEPLAVNLPSFNVTITPAFLPDDDGERQAVFERLSLLTGVPVTNTVQQEALLAAADPTLVDTYAQLARLYGSPVDETLDEAGVVPLLPDSITEIVDTFSFAPFLPAVITTGVTAELAYTIEQEAVFLPGVRIIPQPIRHYPTGELTAHIIGFMGPIPNESWLDRGYERDDRVGLFGLEVSQETLLAGRKGERQIEVDWTGRELRQIGVEVPPEAGLNLHLTLDMELQRRAYQITQEWLDRRANTINRETGLPHEAKSAAVVAMNPNTGEILALVNVPTFDNNRFATEIPVEYYLRLARDDYEPLFNRAIGGQYPPGSVYKLITAAAAMQEGTISPERLLRAPGIIEVPNRFAPNDPGRAQQFVCWIYLESGGEHGLMNMTSGLINSCDIYFYKINGGFDQDGETVEGVGVDRLSQYSNQFGMGIIQGLELPLEAPGNIPTRNQKRVRYGEPWSTGDDYNMAIGQGFVTSTPMQVAQMAAVVANGGFLYRPTIIHHVTNEDGEIVQDFEPRILQAVDVDRRYLDIIANAMRRVPLEGGTAATLRPLDDGRIATAGKTGTAEYCDNIAIKRGWCFEGQEVLPTHAWYVAYAPADNPEIVVAAFMYNGGEGSRWAGPIAQDVLRAYFGVDEWAPENLTGPTATAVPGPPAP